MGITLWEVPLNNGRFELVKLFEHCMRPVGSFYGISSLLVEGGPKTWAAFKEAWRMDEEVILVGK